MWAIIWLLFPVQVFFIAGFDSWIPWCNYNFQPFLLPTTIRLGAACHIFCKVSSCPILNEYFASFTSVPGFTFVVMWHKKRPQDFIELWLCLVWKCILSANSTGYALTKNLCVRAAEPNATNKKCCVDSAVTDLFLKNSRQKLFKLFTCYL